jgi:hypothetical protein
MIERRRTLAGDLFSSALWLAWQCVRLLLLLFLGILEPVVTVLLGSLAFLGLLMTLFWWSVRPPYFPIALMLGLSLGLGVALAAYHALLRLLNR